MKKFILTFLIILLYTTCIKSRVCLANNDGRERNNSEDGFVYAMVQNSNGEDEAYIEGYKGQEKNVYIPNKIHNLTISGIALGAFSHSDIEEVYIPATVREIEVYAFAGSKIRNVNIPKGCKVETEAFEGCNYLEEVYVDKEYDVDSNKGRFIYIYSQVMAKQHAKIILLGSVGVILHILLWITIDAIKEFIYSEEQYEEENYE